MFYQKIICDSEEAKILTTVRFSFVFRRIAEVKANERKKALEEILYALVVKKFMDADVSLMPSLTLDSSGR